MDFLTTLQSAWRRADSMLCVGLDPDPRRMPAPCADDPRAFLRFCTAIVDATAPYACAFKPQIAYFAAERAEEQLEALIEYVHRRHPGIPVILDAKRGDIGPTAEQYAREAFERYGADAVTVNPFMGQDSIEPYLSWSGRGVFLLCRTSNPGGSDLQALEIGGEPLYLRLARMVAGRWNAGGQLGLVVGATYPDELARVRAAVGDLPLLVPGIGTQGGDVARTVTAGRDSVGRGMLISSSRAILYAGDGADFAQRAADAARATRDLIRGTGAG